MKKLLIAFILSLTCFKSAASQCGSDKVYCGISIINLLANPEQFDGKNIRVKGYFKIYGEGPYYGYWIGLFREFDIPSSIQIRIPDDYPQKNWVKDGEFYSISGEFKNCRTLNCRPELIPVEGQNDFILPLVK